MTRPFLPFCAVAAAATQSRAFTHVAPLSRRGLVSGVLGVAVAGPSVLGARPSGAAASEVLAFRGVEAGQLGVIRAQGVVADVVDPRARCWPVTETTLVAWTDEAGLLTEHRRRRLQVQIAGKICEHTRIETETLNNSLAHDMRIDALGLRTLLLPGDAPLSEADITAICAAPATAELPAALNTLRVIQATGSGSARRMYLTERTPSAADMGFAHNTVLFNTVLLWRMAGTLTRWASSPATNVEAV